MKEAKRKKKKINRFENDVMLKLRRILNKYRKRKKKISFRFEIS